MAAASALLAATSNATRVLAPLLLTDLAAAAACSSAYGDAQVANRDIRVWHGATEKTALE
jgi:hypothetical protein